MLLFYYQVIALHVLAFLNSSTLRKNDIIIIKHYPSILVTFLQQAENFSGRNWPFFSIGHFFLGGGGGGEKA